MQNSVQKNHLLELYPCITLLNKNAPFDVPLFSPLGLYCPPFPQTFVENPGDARKIPPNSQNLPIFFLRDLALNKFTFYPIQISLPTPSNTNFHVIILCKLHMYLWSLLLYHFFKQTYVQIYHANFDAYWMLLSAWQKEWMLKISSSKISIHPTFQWYLGNPAPLNSCFPLFSTLSLLF